MQSRAVALVKLARYLGRRSMYASEDPRSPSGRSRGSDRLVAVLTGLVAAAVYVALGQTTLHHNDGHRILELIGTGELDFGRHHLATPVMYAFHQVVGAPLGLPPFQSVTLLNGVSSAVAVGLFYSGVRALGVCGADAVDRDRNPSILCIAFHYGSQLARKHVRCGERIYISVLHITFGSVRFLTCQTGGDVAANPLYVSRGGNTTRQVMYLSRRRAQSTKLPWPTTYSNGEVSKLAP